MSNCDQNCEAVSGLNDYAANLIEYSKRIDRWVNGGQEEFVQVGGVQTPTLRNLAMSIKALMGVHPDNKTIFINQDKEIYVKLSAIIASGGGLNIDSDGKLFVDVPSMNTQVFQELMRTIKVPIWLTGNTNFYVNPLHPNAGNNIIDGRGTINAPFATIQACVNYVTSNFNIVGYNATIRIASGTYDENLLLGIYSRTTGAIILAPYDGATSPVNINLSGKLGIQCIGAPYYFYDLNLNFRPVTSNPVWHLLQLCSVEQGGELVLRACKLSMTDLSGISSSSDCVIRLLACYTNGTLRFQPSLSGEWRTSISFMRPSNKPLHVLHAERGANIIANATDLSQSAATIDCSGSCSNFLYLNNSNFTRVGGWPYYMNFSGSVTGQRYMLVYGSSCITMGGGENYFPGNSSGSVEADTYCWYK